tara:strand:- start:95 stop:280 length:186 start_codon:yes stop_codon:yes gene_type:complete
MIHRPSSHPFGQHCFSVFNWYCLVIAGDIMQGPAMLQGSLVYDFEPNNNNIAMTTPAKPQA